MLSAVAGGFERDFGFGVVRQLFETPIRALGTDEQHALLAGAAGLARPLLLPAGDEAASETAALMHGLYWLVANLSEERPRVLCVDDAQWCDPASLAWLLYLARRLDDLPVLLIVAVRGGEPEAQGSAQVVRDGLQGAVDDEMCRACFEVTGGNPFLLRELVRAVGDAPSGPMAAERIRGITPRTVSHAVIARLGRLPAEAAALAVLGGRAQVRDLLALSGVAAEPGMAAIDALEREQIASGRPVRFVHPLVGAAVYDELPPATRSLDHARAAWVLAASGTDPARVASHLLHAEPAGDPWAVAMLRDAARDARRDGAPEAAVPWLTRALAEPPGADERAAVLYELGTAEFLAGASANGAGSSAERHLAQAVAGASDPAAVADAALAWGDALCATHHYVDAMRAFDRGIAAVADSDSELTLRIEAHAAAAGRLDLTTCAMVSRRLERFGREPSPSPAGRLMAGVLAIEGALAGDPAPEVGALAERMLDGGRLPNGKIGTEIPLFATNALLWCDRLDHARRLLDEMIATARAAGSVRSLMVALCWRGLANHRSGQLAQAAGDLVSAIELAVEHRVGGTAVTHAMLAEVLVDQGDVAEAGRALEPVGPVGPADELPSYVGWNYVLHARGVMRAARLQLAPALEDFLACGDRQERGGARNPSVIAWRSDAALALMALGDHDRAVVLATEELDLARRFGTPRPIGMALRALGLLERGTRQIALLRDAVSVLEGSEARLEHARALTDLGGALRRRNERAAAREPLRDALDLAARCGATALARRAHDELAATGARPRTLMLTGVDALTPMERQAASMAAEGMANPEIAQALFISRKTVEKRLSEAYRKLGIRSRTELADALAAPREA